jgi:hypothetical protein
MSQPLKNFYLARRNPALSADAFARRWRRHGELAMSLPLWRYANGYQHCDVLAAPPADAAAQIAPAWNADYDGVGIVYFDSPADMEQLGVHPEFPTLLADESGAFSEAVANTAVMTTEQELRRRSGVAAKLIAFLRARDGDDAATFRRRWDRHVGLVLGAEETERLVLRYSHNHPIEQDAVDDGNLDVRTRISIGLTDIAGVAEIGFASVADLAAYLALPSRRTIGEDLETFVDLARSEFVATNEVVMAPRRVAP